MKQRFRNFMNGRYGADQLSQFIMIVCCVCLVVNLFTGIRGLYFVTLILLGLLYYRMFSRDFARRRAENQKYLDMTWKIRSWFRKKKDRLVQSKDFHIYRCPSCGQKIRIPRGKGHICITCPKCRHEFEKKS